MWLHLLKVRASLESEHFFFKCDMEDFWKVRNVFGKWGSFSNVWASTEITNVLKFKGKSGTFLKILWNLRTFLWNLSEVTTFCGGRPFWNMNSVKVRTCLERYDALRRGKDVFGKRGHFQKVILKCEEFYGHFGVNKLAFLQHLSSLLIAQTLVSFTHSHTDGRFMPCKVPTCSSGAL